MMEGFPRVRSDLNRKYEFFASGFNSWSGEYLVIEGRKGGRKEGMMYS